MPEQGAEEKKFVSARNTDGKKKRDEKLVVMIPEVEGRVFQYGKGKYTYVDFVYDHSYDPEKKQTRNKKVTIGKALPQYPGIMIANENYRKFFDIETGELLRGNSDTDVQLSGEEIPVEINLSAEAEREPGNRTAADEIKQDGATSTQAVSDEEKMRIAAQKRKEADEQRARMLAKMKQEEEERRQAKKAFEEDKLQYRILEKYLDEIYSSIQLQTRKNPAMVVSKFKVRKINELLGNIQEYLDGTRHLTYLDLIPIPKEVDMDGVKILEGLTYSDVEILMGYYKTALFMFYDHDLMGYD